MESAAYINNVNEENRGLLSAEVEDLWCFVFETLLFNWMVILTQTQT